MDDAYSSVSWFFTQRFKRLIIAALTAAIVASLAGKANSISQFLRLDIYKKYINKECIMKKKWCGLEDLLFLCAMIVGILLTWKDLLVLVVKVDLHSFKNIQAL